MSEAKHTPGPWRHQQGFNNIFTTTDPKNGVGTTTVIATVLASQVAGSASEANANARRIVSCVNACEGFSIEELEGANLFKDSIESQDLIDGLLAALKFYMSAFGQHLEFVGQKFDEQQVEADKKARAAISKATNQ